MQNAAASPVTLHVALTRQCNLRCRFCPVDARDSPHPGELDTWQTKRLIGEAAGAGARHIVFGGGEPLLRHDLYELVAHARDSGLQCTVSTNGVALSTEVITRLKDSGVSCLEVSLHGSNADTHDSFSGMPGSFMRTVTGITNIAVTGIPFKVSSCISHHNLSQLESIADLARQCGAFAYQVCDFVPVGRAKEHPELVLTPAERRQLAERLTQRRREDSPMLYGCTAIPQFSAGAVASGADDGIEMACRCCSAGISSAYVLYDGTVYPCAVLQKSAGSVHKKSFGDIWQQSKVLKTLRDRDRLGGRCKTCPQRQTCGGARCLIYSRTGSLNKEDQDCWLVEDQQ